MCGIAGFLRTPTTPQREAHAGWAHAMGQAIVHRGPDAGDIWLDDYVALSHRRLSILDLSEAGNQPMISGSGRYVISYNGEIYNYPELKAALVDQGISFRTRTDTEVLLALYELHGPRCLEFLNGMFAIAIWDRQTRQLFLARDRLGKKPLYYYECDDQFAFASELKALLPVPFVRTEIRHDAIRDYFAYQYIPDPKTIYKHAYKLPPGFWMLTDGKNTQQSRYWDVSFSEQSSSSEEELAHGLHELIDDAVRLRMVSDVPLGAFLSGGVDSSAVVGLMAAHSSRPVTTCSIGFDSKRFDEVVWARQVAKQFGTDHHEFTVRENVADNLQQIARYFDEPFADSSFVPTYFVSKLARQKVTVALAGDGGDENFAGYSKYNTDQTENRLRALFPKAMRRLVFPGLAQICGSLPGNFRKAGSLLDTLSVEADEGLYRTNCFFRPEVWNQLAIGELRRETEGYDPGEITRSLYRNADASDHLSRVLYTDIKSYLPGDILVKVDRMSMANSLETRAPLLDYRVVEYAASIPSALKLRGREKKHILKQAFNEMLTEDILYRKKMGFAVPLAQWLSNELNPLASDMFASSDSVLKDWFDMGKLHQLWQCHLSGDHRYTQELWGLLSFGLWCREWGK